MTNRLSDVYQLIAEIIAEPTANLTSALLLFGVLVLILLIMVVVAAFFLLPEDEGADRRTEKRPARRRPNRAAKDPSLGDRLDGRELVSASSLGRHASHLNVSRLQSWPVLAVITVLLVMAAGSAYWITSTDRYCVSCHSGYTVAPADEGTVPVAANATVAHQSVNCVACHESRLPLGLPGNVVSRSRHLVGRALGRLPSAAPIASDACVACHSAVLDGVTVTGETGVRVSHAEPMAAGMPCTECHSDLGHGETAVPRAGMTPCVRCHDGTRAPAECAFCHTKDVARSSTDPLVFAPVNLPPVTDCGGCHDQGPCDACHGTRMPHPQTFIDGEHARYAGFDKKRDCWRCHDSGDCGKCHQTKPESRGYWGHGDGSFWKYQHGRVTPPGTQAGCGCHGRSPYARAGNYCEACH